MGEVEKYTQHVWKRPTMLLNKELLALPGSKRSTAPWKGKGRRSLALAMKVLHIPVLQRLLPCALTACDRMEKASPQEQSCTHFTPAQPRPASFQVRHSQQCLKSKRRWSSWMANSLQRRKSLPLPQGRQKD